ncbi:MAG: CAP domain-containing protein, partial [Dehalococcoidia bacterium]
MRRSRFFRPLILVAATCSLAGLARELVPLPANPAAGLIAPATSDAASTLPADGTAAPVTQELAQALATPTPAAPEEPAVAAAGQPVSATVIASIPSNLTHAIELASHDDKAATLLDSMNAARIADGVRILRRSADLDDVALARAKNLVANGYFDHYAPDGESAFSELGARGIHYRLAGENLARNNYAENRTVEA